MWKILAVAVCVAGVIVITGFTQRNERKHSGEHSESESFTVSVSESESAENTHRQLVNYVIGELVFIFYFLFFTVSFFFCGVANFFARVFFFHLLLLLSQLRLLSRDWQHNLLRCFRSALQEIRLYAIGHNTHTHTQNTHHATQTLNTSYSH